jgi:hypothetical protein
MSSRHPARRDARPPARASDADRERTVRALREHYAAGRLTADELEERIASAYEARERAELRALTRDLPLDLRRRRAAVGRRMQRAAFTAHATAYAATNTALVGLWAIDGGAFWPAGPILGWGVFLGAHALGARRALRRRR